MRTVLVRVMAVLGLGGSCMLAGCNFFSSTSSATSATSTGGSFLYAVNQTTDTLTGISLASGTLAGVTGTPFTLATGLAPQSATITRPNTFLYVGGTGAIECFSLATTGVPTLVNATAASASARFVSLDTSYDGKWLFALDSIAQTIYVYGINTSTGALAANQTLQITTTGSGTVVPSKFRIAPNNAVALASLGTGGDAIFTFNTTTGLLTQTYNLTLNTGFSDNASTFDGNSAYVYIARSGATTGTSGVSSYSVGTNGALTQVTALAVSGDAPYSVLLDLTGAYLYTANRGSNTVSGYTVSSGSLTALSGSPYSSGTTVTTLARDAGGKYIVAGAFNGSSDLTLYAFDAFTSGKLDAIGTAASGTDPAGTIAVTATHTSTGL